jgi:putative heme iron utilization protein
MDADDARLLRCLLDERPTAALATLHQGEPAASMVPFVLPPGETGLLVLVSGLSPHTRDMQAHARVGLLVTAETPGPWPPHALPRVSLDAQARGLERGTPAWARAQAQYLGRFPDMAQLFDLGDFRLVVLQPQAARLVAGFGRAHALVGEPLQAWLRGPHAAAAPGA